MTAQIIKVHSDSSSLLIAAVTDFLKLVESRDEGSKQMSVVLTGGSLGIGFLKELSRQGADLSGVDFVFGDERFVGLSDDDRNEHQGILAFPALSHLNLKRFPDPSLSLQDAKNAMNKAMEAHYGRVDDSGDVFDLVLLGVNRLKILEIIVGKLFQLLKTLKKRQKNKICGISFYQIVILVMV